MEDKVYTKSNSGNIILSIELIITMVCLDSILQLRTNLHPFIRISIDIFIAIIIFLIFSFNKIGCIIVSLFYSIIWSLFIVSITNEFSHGDKIWIILSGGIAFLISLGLHLSFNEN